MRLDPVAVSSTPARGDIVEDCTTLTGFDGIGQRCDPHVAFVPQSHALRVGAEDCIRDVYRRVFGASDLVLPRTLIAWLGDDDRPLCAAGLRTAADGFFSEIYLDAPIEDLLSNHVGEPVARESIVEVTTLASRCSQVSTAFLRQLALLGRSAGFGWAFFTATAGLRELLGALGVPTFELAPADPRRLSSPEQWGSYYTQCPRVCAVGDRWLASGAVLGGKALRHA